MARRRLPHPEIPGYTWLSDLESGGYADVYEYQQYLPRRRVAIKVLDPDPRGATRARLAAEADAMVALSGHDNVAVVHEVGVTADDRPYLVMEYYERGSMKRRLLERGPLPEREVLRIGVRLCGALETAHRAGIMHRDIKPANILIGSTRAGEPKLSDFGIATIKVAGAHEEPAAMSLHWTAPELLLRSGEVGVRADIYSLAATLYTLLTGHPPFDVPSDNSPASVRERVIAGGPRPIEEWGISCRPELRELLMQAMARDPVHRQPDTAERFANRLRQVQTVRLDPLTEPDYIDLPPRAPRPPRERPAGPATLDEPGGGPATSPEDTLTQVAVPPDSRAPAPASGGPKLAVLVSVLALALVGAGVFSVMRRGAAVDLDQTPGNQIATPGHQIADAVPGGGPAVPSPQVSAERLPDGSVRFTWTYDGWTETDYYRVKRIDLSPPATVTELEREHVARVSAGDKPCIEVTVYRADGRGSDRPGRACIQ